MSKNEPVLQEIPHDFPFYTPLFFLREDIENNQRFLETLICQFVIMYLEQERAQKNGDIKVSDLIVDALKASHGGWPFEIKAKFATVYSDFARGKSVTLYLNIVNVSLSLRRFGKDVVGIKAIDVNNKVHKSATTVLSDMRHRGGAVRDFIQRRTIIVPLKFIHNNESYYVHDLEQELKSLSQYAPSITWCTSSHERLGNLMDDYIDHHEKTDDVHYCGVEIGEYYGVTIRASLGFDKYHDKRWLRGSVVEAGMKLRFPTIDSSDLPYVRYFVSMASDKIFNEPDITVDYEKEQQCHSHLMKLLHSALTTRYLNDCSDSGYENWRLSTETKK
jgi:hypothetical protein